MKTLEFLATVAFVAAVGVFGVEARYPTSFLFGCVVLLIPFHYLMYRLIYRSWPMNFGFELVCDVAFPHLIWTVFIGMGISFVRTVREQPFFGWDIRDEFNGFLVGSAYLALKYYFLFRRTNWSKKYMLRAAYVPFIAAEGVGAIMLCCYSFALAMFMN